MKKNIKVKIKNNEGTIEYTTRCIFDAKENTIKYMEDGPLRTRVTFYIEERLIRRRNKEIETEFQFDENKETKGFLTVKDNYKKINLELAIKTEKIVITDKLIDIKYKLEDELCEYIVEVL